MSISRSVLGIGCASVSLTFVCCASQPHRAAAGLPQGRTVLASIAPMPATDEPAVKRADREDEEDEEDGVSAASLLELGFRYFREERPGPAGESFRAAIATGNLNDAGRALAYWHIFIAERSQGHLDRGADALSSFVAVGADVLAARSDVRYAVDESGDFVDRFDLERRLSRARALLSAEWAAKVPSFGRSPALPVPIHSAAELGYFLELAPPCADAEDRRVSTEPGLSSGLRGKAHVRLSCGPGAVEDYYFETTVD